jgi:hypothetical protein
VTVRLTRRQRFAREHAVGADDTKRPADTLPTPAQPRCPTCGCSIHAMPKTWEVTCESCGQKRWPQAVVKPETFVCQRCLATSPERRAATRAAGKASAERRRKASLR